MSTSTKAGYLGRRRAEDLPERRWLQLGAASAGMGAALIGWSLIGFGMGVAGADTGVGSSSTGPASASSKRANADARSTAPRTVNRTVAAAGGDAPSQVPSRSNRVTAAGASSVADRLANATIANSRVASRAPTSNSNQLSAARNAVAPVVVAASRADPLGALGKFVTGTIKELLNRKTTLNPLQKLDDLNPNRKSLLDLIPSPKVTVPKEHSLWYREVQASEAARQQRADENQRRIAEIMQKGVKFTARDGTPVYSIDGKVFVRYAVVSIINGKNEPPVPRLFTLSDRGSERNREAQIKYHLKLEPAQVRSLRGK